MDETRAALYCRLSRVGGHSIQRQKQDGLRIARTRGWTVPEDAIYPELGSASKYAAKPRKKWNLLLEAIRRGEYDAVILWMVDRSNRDIVQAGEFVKVCDQAGLRRIVLPDYEYDLTNDDDRIRFYQEVLDAQREVTKTSKRVRRARLQEAEDGTPHPGGNRGFGDPGGRRIRDPQKLGAEFDDDPFKWLRDEPGRWLLAGAIPGEQLHAERELIREAAFRIRTGDSLRGIVGGRTGTGRHGGQKEIPARSAVPGWAERGVTAPGGDPFTTRSLKRLLLQPRLAGWRSHNGELVTDSEGRPVRLAEGVTDDGRPIPQVPILKPDVWLEVREILTDPARNQAARTPLVAGRGGTARHLLAGMVFCGVCGAKLRARHPTGQRTYECPGRSDGGRNCVRRDAERLEKLITGALFGAVESDAWGELAAEVPGQEDPSRELYESLARDQALLDRADDAVTAAELAGDKRKLASLQRTVRDIEERMERTRARISRRTDSRIVAEIPRNLRQVWESFSLDRQRAIIASVLRLPADGGKGIRVFPQGSGRHVFEPATIRPDWKM